MRKSPLYVTDQKCQIEVNYPFNWAPDWKEIQKVLEQMMNEWFLDDTEECIDPTTNVNYTMLMFRKIK